MKRTILAATTAAILLTLGATQASAQNAIVIDQYGSANSSAATQNGDRMNSSYHRFA